MHMNETRQKEIAEAEAEVARITSGMSNAEMSHSRYFSSGRHAKDKAELAAAKARLANLKAVGALDFKDAEKHDHGKRMRPDGSTF